MLNTEEKRERKRVPHACGTPAKSLKTTPIAVPTLSLTEAEKLALTWGYEGRIHSSEKNMEWAFAITSGKSSFLRCSTQTLRFSHTAHMITHTMPRTFLSMKLAHSPIHSDTVVISCSSSTLSPNGDPNQMHFASSHCIKACIVVSLYLPQHGHVSFSTFPFANNKDLTSSSSLHASHTSSLHAGAASA